MEPRQTPCTQRWQGKQPTSLKTPSHYLSPAETDLKAPSCPSLSFPHPLPQITKTVSGFAKGLRTYPIPPRRPKACSVPGPMWGAAVKRNRIKTCLTSLAGEEPFLQVTQPLLVHLQGLGAHYNPCSWSRAHQS